MKVGIVALLVLVGCSIGVTQAQSIDYLCLIGHCGLQSVACGAETECRTCLNCIQGCQKIPDNSTQKLALQNCTIGCLGAYSDDKYDAMMSCIDTNNCITLTPITVPCRTVTNALTAPMTHLKGYWWVAFGLHPVYDCLPCQYLSFLPHPENNTWVYHTSYEIFGADGQYHHKELDVPVNASVAEDVTSTSVTFAYHSEGLNHEETWHVLETFTDQASGADFALVYYCGGTRNWQYEGVLALSSKQSNPTIPDEVTNAYAALGIDSGDFCHVGNSCSMV
eukprot:TRINITY_DN1636_c0_g1_i1.p1 TRINITY_DN1636_c0_g1~~TRINITY_DN1636_c0_g1_i1.p1  ORF type:complete len:279 (-),score=51.21 TRINITY_DN1636_c0_g1_i1:532-1368(-)